MSNSTKTCTRKQCKQINPQPLSAFSKNKSEKGGLAYTCKSCCNYIAEIYRKNHGDKIKESQAKYRKNHVDKIREGQAKHYKDHTNKCKESRSIYCKENPSKVRESKVKYNRCNPNKIKSHKKLSTAIRSGKLTRLPCQVCGEPRTDAHHWSYLEEHVLDVHWLCPKHHREVHRINYKGSILSPKRRN